MVLSFRLTMAIKPSNSHFHQQWNLQAIRAPEAWAELRQLTGLSNINGASDITFGSADIVITVLDTGIASAGGQPLHAAFKTNVSNGLPKVLALYDFSKREPDPAAPLQLKFIRHHNDRIHGAHGSECAGIAVAGVSMPGESSYVSESAIAGVAPNCRVIGVIYSGGAAPFYWVANMGLDYLRVARWEEDVPAGPAYRLPSGTGTDIVSISLSLTSFDNIAFDYAAYGRQGRGITTCLAAGNSNSVVLDSISNRIIVVAATQIPDDGDLTRESRASYSEHGKRLDVCAPAGGARKDTGANRRLTNTAVPPDCGTFDRVDSLNDWNVLMSVSGGINCTVQGVMPGIFTGQFVAVGDPDKNTYQVRRITAVDPTAKTFTVDKPIVGTGLTLGNLDARIPYRFALTTGASAKSVLLASADAMAGFAADQQIYIFDPVSGTGERARVKKRVGTNELQLSSLLTGIYGNGARVVQGKCTATLSRVSNDADSTKYTADTTDGFVVGQLVRILDGVNNPIVGVDEVVGLTIRIHIVDSNPNSPSVDIETVGGGEYTSEFNGTSASTPMVAGTAALVLSAQPLLSWLEVRYILRETAQKIDLQNGDWIDEQNRPLFAGSILQKDVPPTTLRDVAGIGDTTIALNDVSNVSPGLAIRLFGSGNEEFAVVLDVAGQSIGIDRALKYGYIAGAGVTIGRRPSSSVKYGRGRIDAMRAVKMAAAWNPADRDLWIRDFVGDTGASHTMTTGIDSPDVWVRIIAPDLDGVAAIPAGNASGPHQSLNAAADAWIYVRVRNRGTLPTLEGMEVVVSFTDTADPSVSIQFPFPERWQMRDRSGPPYDERTAILTPIEGTFQTSLPPSGVPWSSPQFPFKASPALPLLDPVKPHVLPAIAPGSDFITIIPWRGADVPSQIKGRAFLKVHITPFDGLAAVSGLEVHTNNNLTFKEIHIRSIALLDGTGAEFLESILIPTSGVIVAEPFMLEIAYIPMTAEKSIVLTATLTRFDVSTDMFSTDQKVFAWDGTAWSFGGGPPTWLAVNQPVFTATAGLERERVVFPGNFFLDHTHAGVSLHVAVNDDSTLVIERTIDVKVKAVPPLNANGIGASNAIVFRTFADWDLLRAQDGTKNYGPLPAPDDSTRYRTAAMFTGIQAGGTKVKAYAITAGHAFIQEITGSTTQVNLVLRPLDPIDSPRGPVKYLVYRGLRRASFLDSSGAVLPDAPAVNNDLLNRNWSARNSLNAEEKHLDPAFVDLKVTRDDLGMTTLPNPPLADATPIGEVFDRYPRWTRIDSGAWIGDFEHAGSYGFEIIIDGPGPEPTLASLRVLDHTVDITYTPGQPKFTNGAEEDLLTRTQRERILRYVDPAAFIGTLAGGNIERNTSAGLTVSGSPHPIRTAILQQFATRDVVYLDIRNELNQSLNFYGNYGDGTALNAAQIQVRNAAGAMVPRAYHDHGWPILALKAGVDIPADTTADKVTIRIALPVGDNNDPVLYLAGAAFAADFPGYALKFAILNPLPGPVTNAFELGVHNDKTDGIVLPAAIRIVYARRYAGASNPVFPAARPLKDDLIDTLLSPDSPALVPPAAGMTTWDTNAELRYIGWTSKTGFDFTVRAGRAQDDFGEIAFAYAEGPAELHGGTSARAIHMSIDLGKGKAKTRSFYEHLKNVGLARLTRVPTNSGPPIPALRVQSVHDNFSISVFDKSADNLFSIAYSTAEATAIRGVTSQFVAGAPLSFAAINHEMTENGDQFPYFSMNLGVLGSAVAGNTFEVRRIDTGVKLYSFDGRNYFSAAYTNAVELLPFVE